MGSLRRKVGSLREELGEDGGTSEEALDFYIAKQAILSSYFQAVNLLILKRVNGLRSDFASDAPSEDLRTEFGLGRERRVWGASR